MPAPRIRADHGSLKRIAQTFAQEAEITKNVLGNLKNQMAVLQSGDWIGKGATAFYSEMTGQVLPAMNRLVAALNRAAEVTREISAVMQQAEQDAATLFVASAESAGSVSAPVGTALFSGSVAIGAASPSSVAASKQKQPVANGSGGQGPSAPLEPIGGDLPRGAIDEIVIHPPPPPPKNRSLQYVARSPNTIFAEPYLSKFGQVKMKGENSDKLNSAMEKLLENPSAAERDRLLKIVAQERGKTLNEIRSDYNRFLGIRRTQQRTPDQLDITSEWFDSSDFPDFLGSTPSLQYGKVVGDVFGIDPVFGALLNPTGGIMGPGSSGLPQPGPNTPLSYHSIFHDAGGYLRNYHELGPGYDYLGWETEYDPTHPLTGQLSGMQYWFDRENPDRVGPNAAEWAMEEWISLQGGRQSNPARR